MRINVIKVGRQFLVSQMNHCVYTAAAVTVMGALKMDAPLLWLWLLVGLVPFGLYEIRCKVRNFFLFFGLHLLMPAAMFLCPVGIWSKLILFVITLIYVIVSIRIRIMEDAVNEESEYNPAAVIGAVALLTVIQKQFGQPDWEKYYMYLIFGYLACYFVYYFVDRYLRFLQVNDSSASNIPERAIFVSGLKQTLVCTGGAITLLFMTANVEWLSYILRMLGQGALAVIRFLMSFIKFEGQEEEIVKEQQSGGPGGMEGMMEPGEAGLFWIILEKLMMFAVSIGFVVLVTVMLVKGYRYLWNAFHRVRGRKEETVQEGMDVREQCDIEKSTNLGLHFLPFLNNKEKIRKMYRKRVLKGKDSIIGGLQTKELGFLTAKECCDRISQNELQQIYDKARYSEQNITAEDVKNVKAAVKN